jgi:hypothetical protein
MLTGGAHLSDIAFVAETGPNTATPWAVWCVDASLCPNPLPNPRPSIYTPLPPLSSLPNRVENHASRPPDYELERRRACSLRPNPSSPLRSNRRRCRHHPRTRLATAHPVITSICP